MRSQTLEQALQDLKRRHLSEHGYPENPGQGFRPDATAWAILALKASQPQNASIRLLQAQLAATQFKDGRIAISENHPETSWPTALTVLAWHDTYEFDTNLTNAVRYLLEIPVNHFLRKPGDPIGHDPNLRGWPWIEDTHSWVEPTAITLMALQITKQVHNKRTKQAIAMLLDRQLPNGGWNYGNTTVFGKQLHPMPASTGMALQALHGHVSKNEVAKSLDYLSKSTTKAYSPLALGWGLCGLSAWNQRPANATTLIQSSLERQSRYGPYSTTLLSLLIVAASCKNGLVHQFKEQESMYGDV